MVNTKLIVKSNYIVEASYKLSLGEQRVIYVLTSLIKPEDKEFVPYKLTVKEFTEILGTKSKDMYNQISRYVEGLRERDLTIIKEKSILKTKWLSSAEYFIDDGYVELCFDPKLKPYLLLLKERFTKLSLDQMVSFSSQYSGRIYELLKQYERIGIRTFSIEELKNLLGIRLDEYKQYGLFKQRILNKSMSEINHDSDLLINFEEIKTGRKVTSVKFYIKSNRHKDIKIHTIIDEVSAAVETDNNEDIKRGVEKVTQIMNEHNITQDEAMKIYSSAKGDLYHIAEVYDHFKGQKANNFIGLMISMVKPGAFNEPKKNFKKLKFDNFEGRGSDYYAKLEDKFLGWDNSNSKI